MRLSELHARGAGLGGKQTAFLTVGDPSDIEKLITIQVHVTRAGMVEMDIGERQVRRLVFSPATAETLAHFFFGMPHPQLGANISNALLDAAHLAREQRGERSTRTSSEELKTLPMGLQGNRHGMIRLTLGEAPLDLSATEAEALAHVLALMPNAELAKPLAQRLLDMAQAVI